MDGSGEALPARGEESETDAAHVARRGRSRDRPKRPQALRNLIGYRPVLRCKFRRGIRARFRY